MTSEESRVLELERQLLLLNADLKGLSQRASYVAQWMRWVPVGGCTITVTFTVTDSGTGSPVSGATVDLISSGSVDLATGTTDGSGLATLTTSTEDTYTYSVSKTGYATATGTVGAGHCGDTLDVTAALTAAIPSVCCPSGLPTSFTIHDSQKSFTGTMTYDAVLGNFYGCVLQHTTGGGCPTGDYPFIYVFNPSNCRLSTVIPSVANSVCIDTTIDCSNFKTATGGVSVTSNRAPVTTACPPAFHITYNNPGFVLEVYQ